MEKLFPQQTFQACPLLEWFIWLSNLHEMCSRLKIVKKRSKQDSNGLAILLKKYMDSNPCLEIFTQFARKLVSFYWSLSLNNV